MILIITTIIILFLIAIIGSIYMNKIYNPLIAIIYCMYVCSIVFIFFSLAYLNLI